MGVTAQTVDEARLAECLAPEDWQHSLRTAATAVELATRFGSDMCKARTAGLLHDYARCVRRAELPAVADRLGITVDEIELQSPYLLHAEVGARLAAEELGIDDEEILAAVASHTIGRPGMSDLEKIIYLADMIEPARAFEGVDEVREAATRDLDEAFRLGYQLSLEHLVTVGKPIHPRTVAVWNWLCAGRR